MKLMSSLPNYNQPRLQTSVTTLPSARLANAHPPQADAQRSGAAWYRRLEQGIFTAGLGVLLAITPSIGISLHYAERLDSFYRLFTRNCNTTLPIVSRYLANANNNGPAATREIAERVKKTCE